MNISEEQFDPKKLYVLAVSGGVDSMVMLHVLGKILKPSRTIVAHVDHGIRSDSFWDRELVQTYCQQKEIVFEYVELGLGSEASEAEAREARYTFLNSIKEKYHADAVVTAHHQDDLIETALLNVLRGTGIRGLCSLASSDELIRPMLGVSKAEILEYAWAHSVVWREDSTNKDLSYRRNWLRQRVMQDMDLAMRLSLLKIISTVSILTEQINNEIGEFTSNKEISRYDIAQLSYAERLEVLAGWLRTHTALEFDRRTLELLAIETVTLEKGKKRSLAKGVWINSNTKVLTLHIGTNR